MTHPAAQSAVAPAPKRLLIMLALALGASPALAHHPLPPRPSGC
jgi:hypothetical protein